MTPYRVPVGTTEISYTRGAGEQRSIPVEQLSKRYAYAQPADAEDEAHLVGLGLPVARKVLGEDEPNDDNSEAAKPAPPVETSAGTEG